MVDSEGKLVVIINASETALSFGFIVFAGIRKATDLDSAYLFNRW